MLEAVAPEARAVVAGVARLHAAVAHPCLPPTRDRSATHVELDVAPLGTLAQVLVRAREEGVTIDYASALGLGALTAEVLSAIRAADPDRASGRLSGGQIVIDVAGGVHFVGLGTPLQLDADASGAPSPFVATAPEVARGDAPVPSSDVCAAALFATLVVPYLRFPGALGEALRSPSSTPLAEAARYFDAHVATHVVSEREADLSVVMARFEEAWRAAGLTWSARDAADELGRLARRLLAPSLAILEVAPGGARFRRGLDAPVDLSNRAAPRHILEALASDGQAEGPGLDFEQMVAAGWPDERILPAAARARVHMAVSTLRKLGLGDWLKHEDGRYRLARSVRIVRPGEARDR